MSVAPVVPRTAEHDVAEAEILAVQAMFERHRGRVYAYCYRRLRSREAAEDAVQTTYLDAFRALRRGTVPSVEIAWLLGIARNVCIAHWEASRRQGRLELVHDPEALARTAPAPLPDRDGLIALETALGGLTESQRRAIVLREWRGLSYAEIAHELGLSVAAVETLIFRARRALAQSLEEQGVSVGARGKAARALDLSWLGAALKAVLGGSATTKVAACGVAVCTALVVGGSSPKPRDAQRPQPPPVSQAPSAGRVAPAPASPFVPDPVGLPETKAALAATEAKAEAESGPRRGAGKAPRGGEGGVRGEEGGGGPLEGPLGPNGSAGPTGPISGAVGQVTNGLVAPLVETATGTVGQVVETTTGAVETTVGTATGTVGQVVETTVPQLPQAPVEETVGGLLGKKK